MRPCLLLALLVVGCGSSDPSTVPVQQVASSPRQQVLDAYYPPDLQGQLLRDAAPLEATFPPGVRPFSTAQYGERYVEGTLTQVLDVYDARPPANLARFQAWARANNLQLSEPANLTYWVYAVAGTRFLADFGFDAVVYHPDEYHPVFTQPTDTWMFVREDAVGGQVERDGAPYYTSGRFQQRHEILAGGFPMVPLDSPTLWPYYIPQGAYVPFRAVSEAPVSGSLRPELVNPYVPRPATAEQLRRRAEQGFAASPLSNRINLKVASWEPVASARSFVAEGFGFNLYTGLNDRYTWGTSGSYVVPLDAEFWRNP